jgi:hypothetical protein
LLIHMEITEWVETTKLEEFNKNRKLLHEE